MVIKLTQKEVEEAIVAHLGSLAENNTEFLNMLHDMKLVIRPKTDAIGTIVNYDFELVE